MQKLIGKVRAAVERYQLIEEGDAVGVGVSGGKDSLFLLCALKELSRYYPKKFTLTAITADPCFGGQETDFSKIASLCGRLDIPYIVRRTNLGQVVFEDRQETNPCSLCAKMRRGILHNICLEAGCNKIALGHHYDDAVQTFLMNLFYGGKLGCFSPKSYLSRKNITLIRPLIFCGEREIRNAAARMELPVVKSRCPADGATARKDTEVLLAKLEQDFPDLKAKILGAMQREHLDNW
ncbi:tRNA 2-thiocytidine biosynthesis TtcA family protein [uncultured Neglectibacter sp.]|uniref:tRNA 2-thiocytidine biosynthesis TtcA family protein n=1 Tax=uncultured Neglectibacter sp. TaxID=1924108 RepID=UPI0034DEAEDE